MPYDLLIGYDFHSDLKLLSLSSYDMVLGLDWLERFSPMEVHWRQKWMVIPYNGATAVLYGIMPQLIEGTIILVCSLEIVASDEVVVSVPPEIQQLIEEYVVLFEVPTELPPARSCDHTIPVEAGVAPVQIRPYMYASALKDEIEL